MLYYLCVYVCIFTCVCRCLQRSEEGLRYLLAVPSSPFMKFCCFPFISVFEVESALLYSSMHPSLGLMEAVSNPLSYPRSPHFLLKHRRGVDGETQLSEQSCDTWPCFGNAMSPQILRDGVVLPQPGARHQELGGAPLSPITPNDPQ